MVKTAKGIGKNVTLLSIDNENAQSGLRFFPKMRPCASGRR
jgi:hypothetical protein